MTTARNDSFGLPDVGPGSGTVTGKALALQPRTARLNTGEGKIKQNRQDRLTDGLIRLFDIVIALAAIVALLPMMLLTVLAIMLTDRGPIIFAHTRIGRYGETFKCFKFRSMRTNSAQLLHDLLQSDLTAREEWDRDHKLRNDPRITPIGAFLRKSSIDELPQLFNVLSGEMSIVGPRPIVIDEVYRYGRYFKHYCSVRPGITGLWQVSGRNDVSYRRRVACDVVYTRSKSVSGNLKIIAATVPSVLMRSGSY